MEVWVVIEGITLIGNCFAVWRGGCPRITRITRIEEMKWKFGLDGGNDANWKKLLRSFGGCCPRITRITRIEEEEWRFGL